MHRTFRVASALCAALFALPVAADPDEVDLHAWGQLTPHKKTEFFELKHSLLVDGKRRSAKAFLKLSPDSRVFADQLVALESLPQGATVWVYGKPVERESQNDQGQTQVDRQITNTLALASGEALSVDAAPKEEGPGGQKWLQATVARPGASLYVTYEGQEFKVVCMKGFAAFSRAALEETPKLNRKLLVEVLGQRSEERPEKTKDDEPSYSAQRLVLLEKRLQAIYPLLLP